MEWPFNRGRTLNRLSTIAWPAATMTGILLVSMIGIAAFDGCSNVEERVLPGAGACVEFWLNRYQALISALAALGAAAFTARLIITQLSEMRAQRALQAYDAAKRELADIQEEGRLLAQLVVSTRKIRKVVSQCNENIQRTQYITRFFLNTLQADMEDRKKLLSDIQAFRAKCLHHNDDVSQINVTIALAYDANSHCYNALSLGVGIGAKSEAPVPVEIRNLLTPALLQLDAKLAAEGVACENWATSNWRREEAIRNLALRYRASAFGDITLNR